MIDKAYYGIYDLSYWRANEGSPWVMPCNVLIELGIAIALNRPTFLLRHTGNRIAEIELPRSIQSVTQICEFTGGDYSLGKALREHLSRQANLPADCDWQHHHCRFGEIDCSYLQVYPHNAMISDDKLHCHIGDGPDTDQLDFRDAVEKVLGTFNKTISYSYLDKGSVPCGYTFLLCAHCQLIRSTPFAIYRITPDTSPDTYIAIGISIGLEYRFRYKIPRIVITKGKQYVPSLLEGYEVVLIKNPHILRPKLQALVTGVLEKIDKPADWKPQKLPFEPPGPNGPSVKKKTIMEEHRAGAYLVMQKGSLVGRRLELWNDCTTIGRSRDSDIFLDDVTVHRKQATIIRTSLRDYTLYDDHGSGDCFVNGKPVTQCTLRNGDQLSFGQTQMVFYLIIETEPARIPPLQRKELYIAPSLDLFQSTTIASLRLTYPQSAIQSIELQSGMTIGRSRECDIFLEDLTVSRHHATIEECTPGVYEIVDNKSATGTLVNRRPVMRQRLEDGDVIQVGNTHFTFNISAGDL
jgi:pSer/pThr/pTyr-binding forkhead associated (FHA) protein